MKKFGLALAVMAAFTGSAIGADMDPRAYSKAPAPMMAAPSWTGFYLFGGAGGGLWSADSNIQTISGGSALTRDKRLGGSGWFGTAGAGFDWQLGNWVTGVFGDGQFGDIRGSLQDDLIGFPAPEGREKLRTSWAAGVRLGYLVAPNVLSYVNAGYSGSEWSGTNLTAGGAGGTTVFATTPSFHRNGWFFGGGTENSLNIFGIAAPGWFMKTEYRAAYYDRTTLGETFLPAFSAFTPHAITFKPMVQTISSSLVYRFNWGGAPVGARY